MTNLNFLKKGGIFLVTTIMFIAVAVWTIISPEINVRNILEIASAKILLLNLYLLILAGIFCLPKVFKYFSKINKYIWLLLSLILILGGFLRFYVTQSTDRIMFDEDIYINVAQNIYNQNRAIICNWHENGVCQKGEYNKQPNGYPVLLANWQNIFGWNEQSARKMNMTFGTLSAFILFLFTFALSKNVKMSLLSAFFISFLPLHIIWSATGASEISFIFFALLSLLFLYLWQEDYDFKTLIFALLAISFASQIRSEGILLFIFPFIFMIIKYTNIIKYKINEWLLIFSIFLIFYLPALVHILAVRSFDWGSTSQSKLSLSYFISNLLSNINFLLNDKFMPPMLFILTIFGLIILIRKKVFLTMYLWLICFFGIFLFFYSGQYGIDMDTRFALIITPPLIFFASYALVTFTEKISFKKINLSAPILIIFAILYILGTTNQWSKIHNWDEGGTIKQARIFHKVAEELSTKLPKNSYIFTNVPTIFANRNINSLQTWFMSDLTTRKITNGDNSYFIEDVWCQFEIRKNICQFAHQNFHLTPIFMEIPDWQNWPIYKISHD